MAEINGRLIICDRCGKTAFLACTGEGERDGGFTRWNKFEPAPEGWDYHSETGRLCPDCNKEYNILLENFKNAVKTFNESEGSNNEQR